MAEPYYQDDRVTLWHGDCKDVMRTLPDASVHAIVTDPPYGLEFMGKGWDAPWSESDVNADAGFKGGGISATKGAPSFTGSTNPKCLRCKGTRRGRRDGTAKVAVCLCGDGGSFPNVRAIEMRAFQEWCETWAAEAYRVLTPGGHLLAFGGSRTWHRLACAIEDAGFEMRDSIAWLYGSGFPKSLDVSKAIDKAGRRDYVLAAIALGLEVPGNSLHDWTKAEHSPGDAWWTQFKAHLSPEDWQKLERAVVGSGTSGATAGMQNLGPSGIKGGGYDITAPATPDAARWQGWGTALKPAFEPIVVARKPLAGTVAATVLAHGTGALNVDGCRVGSDSTRRTNTAEMGYHGGNLAAEYETGSAAGRWPTNVILDDAAAAELDRQAPDAGASGQAKGATRTGASTSDARRRMNGTAAEAPFYGDAGGASRFFPTFRYEAKAPTSERPRAGTIAHPTVKPLGLMRWLVRLVTPPGGKVLDLFAGSGTTGEACVIEGFPCVLIEREADYLPLIAQRLTKPIETVLDLGALA